MPLTLLRPLDWFVLFCFLFFFLFFARSHPTVHIWRLSSLHGYPVAATSAVGVFAAARRAAHSSSDCWRPSVCCCRSDALEQSARRHHWLCVTGFILPETENFFVLYIISMTTFFSGPWGFHLGYFKNFLCMYVCMYICMYVCFPCIFMWIVDVPSPSCFCFMQFS